MLLTLISAHLFPDERRLNYHSHLLMPIATSNKQKNLRKMDGQSEYLDGRSE